MHLYFFKKLKFSLPIVLMMAFITPQAKAAEDDDRRQQAQHELQAPPKRRRLRQKTNTSGDNLLYPTGEPQTLSGSPP